MTNSLSRKKKDSTFGNSLFFKLYIKKRQIVNFLAFFFVYFRLFRIFAHIKQKTLHIDRSNHIKNFSKNLLMDYKNSFNEYTHGMEASKQKILNDATYTSETTGRSQQNNYQQAMMAKNIADSSLCPNCRKMPTTVSRAEDTSNTTPAPSAGHTFRAKRLTARSVETQEAEYCAQGVIL